MISQHLMQLGDEATGKLGGITREFDSSTEKLGRHGEALDRAAEAARNDIARAARRPSARRADGPRSGRALRSVGHESARARPMLFGRQVERARRTRTQSADQLVAEATDRLAARLAEIETAGAAAARRVAEAEQAYSGTLDTLARTNLGDARANPLGDRCPGRRRGALVEQASAGIGKAGADAAESLATNIDQASSSLDGLSSRVAEQERASQRMIAEIERGLALIDERFTELAANGDERANRFLESLTRARTELDTMAAHAGSQDDAIGSLAERTRALRDSIERLAGEIRESVGIAIGEAQGGADRLAAAAAAARPDIGWLRDATAEASEKLSATGAQIAEQRERSRPCCRASTVASRMRSQSWRSSPRRWFRSSARRRASARRPVPPS